MIKPVYTPPQLSGEQTYTALRTVGLLEQINKLNAELREIKKNCQHSIVPDKLTYTKNYSSNEWTLTDQSARCQICNEILGWYCTSSPVLYCEYGDDECCIHCGDPEERK